MVGGAAPSSSPPRRRRRASTSRSPRRRWRAAVDAAMRGDGRRRQLRTSGYLEVEHHGFKLRASFCVCTPRSIRTVPHFYFSPRLQHCKTNPKKEGVMEAVVVSVGKAALNGLLSGAKSTIAEESALTQAVQRDKVFLADELEEMRSTLRDVVQERDYHKVPRSRVNQLRSLAYDVEDCLQEYSVHLEKPSGWRLARTVLERHRIAAEMKGLRARVEDINQRNLHHQLMHNAGSKLQSSSSIIPSATMFGIEEARRQKDKAKVDLSQLIINEGNQDFRVIAVWGKGGVLGQTVVIKGAYDNLKRSKMFELYAWIRIVHPFNPLKFLQGIMRQFYQISFEETGETQGKANIGAQVLKKMGMMKQDDLVDAFSEHVKEKSYLIVLNDMSSIEEWDEIKEYFPDNKKGSRIIVSTEHGEVASLCTGQESIVSELKQPSVDKSIFASYKKGSQEGIEIIKGDLSIALEESQLIGRKKEIDDIVELLISKNSQQVEEFVFVTIMRPFHLAELLKTLVVRLDQGSSIKQQLLDNRAGTKKLLATMSVGELIEELKRLLNMKSCLIVLDDVSSISEWDQISPYLVPHLKETIRIIVTTRKNDIAEHCSGNHDNVYSLKVLDPNDALHLFRKKVFGKTKDLFEKYHNLVEEEKQILKKCGGLPLAIAAIGGFLASQPKTVEEWRKLNENIRAELEMNPELEIIRAVLEKSYDGLPYHLKSCFLYLSIFPENQTISRRRLVRRWTAEGYSSEAHGKSASQIADDYFLELKNRSMILPSQQSVHRRKSIVSCKVHDLIRDIAISKSAEENLVFRLEEGCSMNIHGPIRHLAISSNWKGDKSEFEGIVDLSRIRSLSLFGVWKPFFISEKMRFLRVLDLEGTADLEYHHLDQIWKLIHLKYLSLRGCRDIDLLPDSLGNLRQLQTLDVRDTCVVALPKTIIKLRKLQYIHAGIKSDHVTEENDSLMERCLVGACLCATCCLPILLNIDGPSCKALTRHDAWNFACCVQFPAVVTGPDEDRGAMVPRGIRKLKDLHTLREVNVGRGNNVLRDIGMLTGLRKLGVSCINKKNGRAFCSAISNLSRLESLSVSSAGKPDLCGCLDEISSPPENLQSLKLYGNLEKLPQWIKELQHLVKLKLAVTRLLVHDAAMEFLGKLPSLEILVLCWLSFQCEELGFKSLQGGIAFRSLRVLTLSVSGIKSVKFDEGAMPKLERLQVTGGVNNEFDFPGLGFLPSINEVQLRVSFHMDWEKIVAAPDDETWVNIYEEEKQEERRKKGELKKKIQEQLAQNTNEPIVTVD